MSGRKGTRKPRTILLGSKQAKCWWAEIPVKAQRAEIRQILGESLDRKDAECGHDKGNADFLQVTKRHLLKQEPLLRALRQSMKPTDCNLATRIDDSIRKVFGERLRGLQKSSPVGPVRSEQQERGERLDIRVDPGRRRLAHSGLSADFSDRPHLWAIAQRLAERSPQYCSTEELQHSLGKNNLSLDRPSVRSRVSQVRERVRALGLTIPRAKPQLGYRFELAQKSH